MQRMRGFNERNPVTIAIVGMVTMVLIGLGVFYSHDLPFIGKGATYSAQFDEAGGLRSGDEVVIAGVHAGSIDAISLDHGHVKVEFSAKNVWIGDRSNAAIKIKTLLGQKYLAIDPEGTKQLDPSTPIPLSRTISPFDVTQALDGLSNTFTQIDTAQLGKSFDALSGAFANTPDTVKATLTGLTDLSRSVASRDSQLVQLVGNTKQLTGTIADSDPQIAALITDGDSLLTELQARSSAITALLKGTETLSIQLKGLVADDTAALAPALAQLDTVTAVLQKNQASLDDAVRLIGPYYRVLNDALGNGHWLDGYVCGLFDANGNPDLANNTARNCAAAAASGS